MGWKFDKEGYKCFRGPWSSVLSFETKPYIDTVGIGISHWTRKAFKQVPPGWMTVLKGDSWPDMKGKGRENCLSLKRGL